MPHLRHIHPRRSPASESFCNKLHRSVSMLTNPNYNNNNNSYKNKRQVGVTPNRSIFNVNVALFSSGHQRLTCKRSAASEGDFEIEPLAIIVFPQRPPPPSPSLSLIAPIKGSVYDGALFVLFFFSSSSANIFGWKIFAATKRREVQLHADQSPFAGLVMNAMANWGGTKEGKHAKS